MKLSVHSFNTGNFIRVTGEMLPSYKFFVREIHFLHDQIEEQITQDSKEKIFLLSGLGLNQESVCSSYFQSLRNFLFFSQHEIIRSTEGFVFFGGIFQQLKKVNIHQYGSYQYSQQFSEFIFDMEKCSCIFEEMVEQLYQNN